MLVVEGHGHVVEEVREVRLSSRNGIPVILRPSNTWCLQQAAAGKTVSNSRAPGSLSENCFQSLKGDSGTHLQGLRRVGKQGTRRKVQRAQLGQEVRVRPTVTNGL